MMQSILCYTDKKLNLSRTRLLSSIFGLDFMNLYGIQA